MLDKIISLQQLDAVKNVIEECRNFVILAHKNPDGDAVGSSMALCLYLKSLGKNAKVVLPNRFPEFLSWLPLAGETLFYDAPGNGAADAIENADAFFCLDFNSLSRLGDACSAVAASPAVRVLIDHHLSPSDEFDTVVSFPEACSTSELVFRIIAGISGCDALSYEMAQCIYTGMMTDTGAFAYASARKDIYLIIAELLSKGIDKDLIYRKVFYNSSLSRMRLTGYVLYEKLKLYSKCNAALITLSHDELQRFYAQKGDTEGLVNQALQLKGVRFSCFLREEHPGKINVSLRSVDDFPCNAVAEKYFNGGGHKNASGGELQCTMSMAVSKFMAALQDFRKELTE